MVDASSKETFRDYGVIDYSLTAAKPTHTQLHTFSGRTVVRFSKAERQSADTSILYARHRRSRVHNTRTCSRHRRHRQGKAASHEPPILVGWLTDRKPITLPTIANAAVSRARHTEAHWDFNWRKNLSHVENGEVRPGMRRLQSSG